MNNTFYGRFFTELFPLESRVRTDLSSTGNKYFSILGDFIERKGILPLISSIDLNPYSIRDLSELNYVDLTLNPTFTSQVFGKEIEDVTVNGIPASKSLKDFLLSRPEYFTYEETKSNEGEVLVNNLADKTYRNKLKNFGTDSGSYIYVDIKEIKKTVIGSGTPYVRLHGKYGNILKEESIEISHEGFYKSKNKYTELCFLNEDLENGIGGGYPIEVDGLDTFIIDIMSLPLRGFFEKEDKRTLETCLVKRLLLKDFISKPSGPNLIYENAVNSNSLIVDLVVKNNKSYLYYYHNYFEDVSLYKEASLEEDFFEELIGFVELRDSNDEPFEALDIIYSKKQKEVLVLRALNEGTNGFKPLIEVYELGIKAIGTNIVSRTKEVSISIDSPEDYLLPEESEIVRLITSNLDLTIKPFIVGKLEDGEVTFLNEDKSSFTTKPATHYLIGDAEDLQDSLETFNFEIQMQESDIELFTITFIPSEETSNILSTIESSNGVDDFNVVAELNKIKNVNINSRIITCSKIKPEKTFGNENRLNLEDNKNTKFKYFWLDDNEEYIYISSKENNLKSVCKSVYNKYFYSSEEGKIYGSEEIQYPIVFTLVSEEEVSINE